MHAQHHVDDDIADQICAQLLYLEGDDDKRTSGLINSPGDSVTAAWRSTTRCSRWLRRRHRCLGLAASMDRLSTSGGAGTRYTLPNTGI